MYLQQCYVGTLAWIRRFCVFSLFFFNVPAPPEIYTLSLHDALPIFYRAPCFASVLVRSYSSAPAPAGRRTRSEEHTSELQSRVDLVCRLLLEKKNHEKDMTTPPQSAAQMNRHNATTHLIRTKVDAPI